MNTARFAWLFAAIASIPPHTQAAQAVQPTNLAALASPSTSPGAPISWADVGAKATAQYTGDGLSVFTNQDGAVRLRCAFQRLDGEITSDGLWLVSTVDGGAASRFRVVADYLGRDGGAMVELPATGVAASEPGLARFTRRGLVEEYSVSVDGVRQDFVVAEPPGGAGNLRVELAVTGACADAAASGVRLVLEGAGRTLIYNRLRVRDANGRDLPARIETLAEHRLAVVVEDDGAAYPVRIDPTFSDVNWASMGGLPGIDSDIGATVAATAVDGSGNLYIGGQFKVVGDVVAINIAKWNGTAWSPVGLGLSANVFALAVSGTDLYVGGNFLFATNSEASAVAVNRIAKWNGTLWSALSSGMGGAVSALAVSPAGDLYAGGFFATAGGVSAIRIAKWDASSVTPSWSALGSGMNATVSALAVSTSGDVYAGGSFTTAGGVPAFYIAKWSAGAWSAVGLGLNNTVSALAAGSAGDVYVGGSFTFATNTGMAALSANRIARWDGTIWTALGVGMNNAVNALAVSALGEVYAGGVFTTAGGVTVNFVAKWSAVFPSLPAWSALGSGMGGSVNALALSGGNLYAGGGFTFIGGGAPAGHLAKWNGSTWSALGSALLGPDNWVQAIALSGTNVYVGGYFTSVGGISANRIARWDGSAWSALGSGMNSIVSALAVSGVNVYAGGYFTTAGGISAFHVAKWDTTTSTWSPLGGGMHGNVFALAVAGTDLVAGGDFDLVFGVLNTRGIARWNGSAWSSVGLGLNATVNALTVSGNDLYAGGDFTIATNAGPSLVSAPRVARWDGTSWSPVGLGASATVRALASTTSAGVTTLYMGGEFAFVTNAGPIPASVNLIARWVSNGVSSTWLSLGSGMSAPVYALAVSGSDLYAGGFFNSAGGVSARRIAKWNGSTWSALGSGITAQAGNGDQVNALAASSAAFYAGGTFWAAGTTGSAYIVKGQLLVANNGTYARAPGLALKIRYADLVSDVNGNPITMSSLGASAQGATLSYDSTYIYYQPTNNNADSFTYTVSNGGGTTTGTINVTVGASGGIAKTITVSGGTATIKFFGIVGLQYDVQRTTSLADPVTWTTLTTGSPLSPAADGSFSYTDGSAPGSTAYYRSLQH